MQDILIAGVDGLKGLPEAITTVFPQTQVQTCIVHLMRNSLEFVSWADRRQVAPQLKEVYRAETVAWAKARLEEFAASEWGKKSPTIAPLWRRHWEHVTQFLAYPQEVRKIIKSWGHFPNDEAATFSSKSSCSAPARTERQAGAERQGYSQDHKFMGS